MKKSLAEYMKDGGIAKRILGGKPEKIPKRILGGISKEVHEGNPDGIHEGI